MAHSRRRQQPDTVRVAPLDAQHSYRRSAVVVGPVKLPSLDELTSHFVAMAAVGPVARVGLRPSTTSTRWRFSPDSLRNAVSVVSRAPDSDPITLLSTLRRSPGEGVRVLMAGDYLAIDFSHGLGELPLLDKLIGVLLGSIDPTDDAVWVPYRHPVSPLLVAGLRGIALAPQRLLPLWRQHRRNAVAQDDAVQESPVRIPPSPATKVARIPGAAVAQQRSERDSALPGVSMFAIYTHALLEAFADSGFDVDPTVTLPFDARGYLPKGWDTLASFSAGLDFTLNREAGPRALQTDMSVATRMARPVANLMVGTLKTQAAMRSGRTADWVVPARPRMRLLHSSIGTVPREPWMFSDAAEARILVASDPAGPCGVTVTTSTVMDTLWLTAEFHDSVFDAERLSAAIDSVEARVHSLIGSAAQR